ncbi:unnamed protein product [Arctogadus glacialis]
MLLCTLQITSNGPRALREPHEHHQAVACTRPQNHQLSITQKTTAVHPSSHSAVSITLEKNDNNRLSETFLHF